MTNYHEIFKRIATVAGCDETNRAIANILNIHENNLSQKIKRDTLVSDIAQWAITTNQDLNYIFYGTGSLPREASDGHKVKPNNGPHDLTTDDLDSYVKVNRYDIEASAGAGALVLDEHVVDQLTFKRSWLQGRKGWDPAELGLLQVRGDSMEPTLKGGDLILVNGERVGLHDGLYVVRLGDDVLVKRLRRIGPNEVEVISDNREIYPPFVSKLNDGLHIIGEVVWFCRELK